LDFTGLPFLEIHMIWPLLVRCAKGQKGVSLGDIRWLSKPLSFMRFLMCGV